ncbi:MFS transporter [Streptomyces sp. NPDC038707]|uniref:MFS transporter n=1 Tax=Streptomyces sp. NPDC038707 TaxID=3154329 RepID=UPI0033C93570
MRSGHGWGRPPGHRLGRRFGWLWAAYGSSALGTWLAFGAFPLIAVQVLDAGPAEVAALSSVGAAVGAAVAVPLGPWMEFRRKRPVLIGMDLVRCAALLTVPVAFAFGVLTFPQLLLVSVVVAAADIAFRAASGAYLKTLLGGEDLLVANARFEATAWTTTIVGPPLGGAAIGFLGPVATVVADAVSYLLSALGIRAMGHGGTRPALGGHRAPGAAAGGDTRSPADGGGARPAAAGHEARPGRRQASRMRAGDLLDGWRYILGDAALRPLFFNAALFNGLVMAVEPLLAVLLLGRFGYAPWQYGLAFAAPSVGGLVGSRLARPLVARFGQHRVLVVSGALRALWPVGLVLVGPGTGGLLLVMGVELGLIFCCGVFNPVHATYRLERTAPDRAARTLSAWTVTTKSSTALLTAVWGVLGGLLGPRTAIGLAGLLVLTTPLLLPRRTPVPLSEPVPAPSHT